MQVKYLYDQIALQYSSLNDEKEREIFRKFLRKGRIITVVYFCKYYSIIFNCDTLLTLFNTSSKLSVETPIYCELYDRHSLIFRVCCNSLYYGYLLDVYPVVLHHQQFAEVSVLCYICYKPRKNKSLANIYTHVRGYTVPQLLLHMHHLSVFHWGSTRLRNICCRMVGIIYYKYVILTYFINFLIFKNKNFLRIHLKLNCIQILSHVKIISPPLPDNMVQSKKGSGQRLPRFSYSILRIHLKLHCIQILSYVKII